MTTLSLKVRRIAAQCAMLALVFMNAHSSRALAQDMHAHPQEQDMMMSPQLQENAAALLKIVREATEKYKDVRVAEGAGYALQFGCVSGSDDGAMGLHYVNGDIV